MVSFNLHSDGPVHSLLIRHTWAVSVASAILLTLSFPRMDAGWLAWIALFPVMTGACLLRGAQAFRLGFVMGVLHYMGLMYWLIHTMGTYGRLPLYMSVPLLFLLACYLSLYFGCFTLVLSHLGRKPLAYIAIAPCAWVTLEYLRGRLFSGFPWSLLGYSQYDFLPIIQISDITGVYGVSFLIVLVNAAVSLAVPKRIPLSSTGRRPVRIAIAVCALVMTAAIGYGNARIRAVDRLIAASDSLIVTIVQGNIEQEIKWKPAFQESTTEKYVRLSLESRDHRPDLVVWPETATPFYLFHHRLLTEKVLQGVRETGAYFLIGTPSFSREGETIFYYNSACLIRPDGGFAGRYDKVHLVPFGEYVPLKKWLPFVEKIVEQIGDFSTGETGKTLPLKNHRIGALICYEGIFPELSRASASNGAEILVNITNDAWYGRSSAPYQHFSMAVFRAVENRKALVRAANTGISGYIDPAGRILAESALFEDTVMTNAIPVITMRPIYTRTGDIFALLCMGVTCGYLLIGVKRRKPHEN